MYRQFELELHSAKTDRVVPLTFREESLSAKQKRLRGRVALVPDIDLSRYTCRAVIDWIDLRLRTDRATQWRGIKGEVEKAISWRCHVTDDRKEAPSERRTYVVRIQDPTAEMVARAQQAVRDRWGLTDKPVVHGLEISVDFRPRTPSDHDLARLHGVLTRTHLPKRDVLARDMDRPRFTWDDGDEGTRHVLAKNRRTPKRNDELLLSTNKDEPVPFDTTLYVGARGAPCAWRTMNKVLDRQNKATGRRAELPAREHRTRIEVTLNAKELRDLEIETPEDLFAFPFQRFQGAYFALRLPTFPVEDPTKVKHAVGEAPQEQRRTKFLNTGVLGLRGFDEAWDRREDARRKILRRRDASKRIMTDRTARGEGNTLVRYEALTRRVIAALRHLGERVGAYAS